MNQTFEITAIIWNLSAFKHLEDILKDYKQEDNFEFAPDEPTVVDNVKAICWDDEIEKAVVATVSFYDPRYYRGVYTVYRDRDDGWVPGSHWKHCILLTEKEAPKDAGPKFPADMSETQKESFFKPGSPEPMELPESEENYRKEELNHLKEEPEDNFSDPMTNRELAEWIAKGNGEFSYVNKMGLLTGGNFQYSIGEENNPVRESIVVRPFISRTDGWVKPTRKMYYIDVVLG